MSERLDRLEAGMRIVYGGDRIATVSPELADAFAPGDMLIVVQEDGSLLHVPADDRTAAARAVDDASSAFAKLGLVSANRVNEFYELAAGRLEDDDVFAPILEANRSDVLSAKARGRSTSRLELTERMRRDMVDGLRAWAELSGPEPHESEQIEWDGWSLRLMRAGLGVVGFVFEGRPNVITDALGLLGRGNTVVFRIGSDALGTARAMMQRVVNPALEQATLPAGSVSLVDARSHASGWALFADQRLGLAVARGSGTAVGQLGAVARQNGLPVSLHGTGGAWIVAGATASSEEVGLAVLNSLDRKVCNTVNTVCLVESRADELIQVVLDALYTAGQRRSVVSKLHVTPDIVDRIPTEWFEVAEISRADGPSPEPRAETIEKTELGREWEWEDSPELTLTVVPDVATAVELFNEQSPRFIASLISADPAEHDMFFETIEAPFVGNGFTRWVDGQYALGTPELGLTNWQHGRLLARGGILSGDSVYTIRSRVDITDKELRR